MGVFADSRTRWDVTNHGFAQIERCFLKHMELWLVWSFGEDMLRNLKIFKHTPYFPLKISAKLWSYLEQEGERISKGSLRRRAECLAISEGWELHSKQHKENRWINFILVSFQHVIYVKLLSYFTYFFLYQIAKIWHFTLIPYISQLRLAESHMWLNSTDLESSLAINQKFITIINQAKKRERWINEMIISSEN